MNISDFTNFDYSSNRIWLPSITDADMSVGISSQEELNNWRESFLDKFGDAELIPCIHDVLSRASLVN